MIFEIFYILKCAYYFFMYKLYSFFNLNKENLLNNLYNFIINLGPFFIKIFQNLSSKQLLPIDLLDLSEKSKNCVYYNTNDYNCILKEIKDTGFEIESEVPIGAGSICLVYKGIYKGNKCVIKICHHSIKQKMERSILLLTFLINILTFFGYSSLINNIDFQDILENINKQIDLNQEVINIRLYKKELKKYKLLNLCDVPDVYEHENNYIIESYIDGLHYHEIVEKYQEKTFESITLLRLISRFQFMYFDIRHGDLHTSNYLYKIENNKLKLYLIDFGLMETIDNTFAWEGIHYHKYPWYPLDWNYLYTIDKIITDVISNNMKSNSFVDNMHALLIHLFNNWFFLDLILYDFLLDLANFKKPF